MTICKVCFGSMKCERFVSKAEHQFSWNKCDTDNLESRQILKFISFECALEPTERSRANGYTNVTRNMIRWLGQMDNRHNGNLKVPFNGFYFWHYFVLCKTTPSGIAFTRNPSLCVTSLGAARIVPDSYLWTFVILFLRRTKMHIMKYFFFLIFEI